MNQDKEQACSTQVARAEKFDEIRHLLNEAHQFRSTSPLAQQNISAALDLLDEIESQCLTPAGAEVAQQQTQAREAVAFALELAEHENDDAAVSFLRAFNAEDAGYLRANWPDFLATHQPATTGDTDRERL